MLSLNDIKNISFRRANFGGYKPEDVDNFIDEVESSYSKLLSEKSKLLKEVEELKKEVNKYHEEEGSIRSAILAAQKLADASIKEAKEKVQHIINQAKSEVEREKVESHGVYREIERFKNNVLRLYEQHVSLLKGMPLKSSLMEQYEADLLETKDNITDKMNLDNCPEASKINVNETNPKKEHEFSEDNCIDSGRIVESEASNKKFENLEFGAEYDIKSDSKKNKKFGFFKRRK